jgi:CubicO group peptidase (beta-lactamase class C family)
VSGRPAGESAAPTPQGDCDSRFAPVREALERSFAEGLEVGASLSVWLDGRPVVDLWGGLADPESGAAWQRDTLVNVYSTTKGPTALCAHRLADRGELDLDAPVARYWPEFAVAGKARIAVRDLLCHRAGLPGFDRPMRLADLYDWQGVVEALAAQAPWWEPGSRHGYHPVSFGHLVGEVVRRVGGRSLGSFFREEVALPLGLDFHIGLPASEDARVARLIPPKRGEGARLVREEPDSLSGRALSNPVIDPRASATREWRGAEIPAANGHGNARSIGRFYAALACGGELDGVRLLSPAALARVAEVQVRGLDAVLRVPIQWGLGLIVNGRPGIYGPNPRAIGHSGYGGSFGFADPGARLAMGYAMNRMGANLAGDERAGRLIQAVYGCLEPPLVSPA